MKKVGYVAVAALLGMGLIRSAQAHVFVGVNVACRSCLLHLL
jgi:hypothetical protein